MVISHDLANTIMTNQKKLKRLRRKKKLKKNLNMRRNTPFYKKEQKTKERKIKEST